MDLCKMLMVRARLYKNAVKYSGTTSSAEDPTSDKFYSTVSKSDPEPKRHCHNDILK